MKKFLFLTLFSLVALNTACPTANAPSGNSTGNVSNTSQSNIPPEFSNQQITPSGNSTPGIPSGNSANLSNVPKGATPTPGIPDPSTIGKTPIPKGATPTPGIPDPETIKKQMNQLYKDTNIVNQVPKNQKELENAANKALKKIPNKP